MSTASPRIARLLLLLGVTLLATWSVPQPALAQGTPQYRGIWVETFNTQLGTRAEIDRVIGAAVASKANAIFAQVRRRGDSWYIDSLEPLTQVTGVGEPVNGTWTLDPLQYLIEQAHARGIEVHAFVIIGAIYNAHPTITGLPVDPKHVFNQHFWDKTANAAIPVTDPRNWSTRSLPHNAAGTTFNGQRYTAEWYIDLGHPGAAAYTVDVLKHLVSRYDLDGLHLDRIRYPEAPIDRHLTGTVTDDGINVGYNETSVNRFKTRYGSVDAYYTSADVGKNVNTVAAPIFIGTADVGYPRTNDPRWNDWRREQVTNFVRRLYLNVSAVKPRLKVSAALICFWTGPVGSGGWANTEANYRVFQDWRAWAQEGTLDILAPMIYKREHTTLERDQYDDWLSFTKNLALSSGRHAMPGLGSYINGIEGTLRQARRALALDPFATNNRAADGVIFYALGDSRPGNVTANSTNAAVTNNPFSWPTPGVSTPRRANADFFAGVTTGASANGAVRFEDPVLTPLFPEAPVPTPDMPWKTAPTQGHAMGFARLNDGTPLDGAAVTFTAIATAESRSTITDGGGFFGTVGLNPGMYRARVELGSVRLDVCAFEVLPGVVAANDARLDTAAPATTASIVPGTPPGNNGWYLGDARVNLAASDDCSGVARTQFSTDDGATWQDYSGPVVVSSEGTTIVSYRSTDAAGNVETTGQITVRVDKSDPTLTLAADRLILWPPNGQLIPVTLSGSAADAISGLSGVTYVVTDEYGAPLGIAPRALSGATASWTDAIRLEARREGTDLDGRRYTIVATITDAAGRTATATIAMVVPHDHRVP